MQESLRISMYWQVNDSVDTNKVACVALNPHTMQSVGDTVHFVWTQMPYFFSISVSATAQFSPGNLQYQPSSDTWRFAEHQYDMIGSDNLNITNNDNTYTGWIDLFSWATAYMPTYVPTNNSMYDYGYDTFFDWGNHPISNGGNQALMWRTPTFAEWNYVINRRANHDSLYTYATVCSVHGMILLPDNWTLPDSVTFTPQQHNWTSNVYDSIA